MVADCCRLLQIETTQIRRRCRRSQTSRGAVAITEEMRIRVTLVSIVSSFNNPLRMIGVSSILHTMRMIYRLSLYTEYWIRIKWISCAKCNTFLNMHLIFAFVIMFSQILSASYTFFNIPTIAPIHSIVSNKRILNLSE